MISSNLDLNKLNKKQLEAVTAPDGPILVIAGAGSGKTRVLTTRIAYLISEFGYHPNRILAITFTNKAAAEMQERVGKLISNYHLNWIGTFHSICLRILREDIKYLGRDSNFGIIDPQDQLSIVKEIYQEAEINQKDIKPQFMLSIIDAIKNSNLNLSDYDNYALANKFDIIKIETVKIIRYVYQKYNERIIEQNLLDFNDLLIYAKKLFDTNEEVALKWQKRFDYILVDEFQDTNLIQFEILQYLINEDHNIFAVGDPDQTIYTWRGAYADIFNDFKRFYNNPKLIILEENYRSTQNILSTSNQLIGHNINRIEKALVTNNGNGERVKLYEADSSDDESLFVANEIEKLIQNKKVENYKDIAVLYRSGYLSRNIEQSLIRKNIPYFVFGGIKFYQRKEIKDLLAYLKLMTCWDEISYKRVCNVPKRKISDTTITKIKKYATDNGKNYFDIILGEGREEIVSKSSTTAINDFNNLIIELRNDTKQFTIHKTLEYIIKKIGYREYLRSLDFADREENIDELLNAINQYEENKPEANINDYLQEISLYTDADTKDYRKNTVNLMTVHMAKGLEFNTVFIIGLNENVFPSAKAFAEKGGLEEERRIMYVAMTRAMQQLYLSYPLGYNYISRQNLSPSRFINELGRKNLEIVQSSFKSISNADLDWYDSKNQTRFDDSNIYNNSNVEFYVGDSISHTVFGFGIVTEVKGDFITIMFKKPYGIKTLLKNHKAMKRLKN